MEDFSYNESDLNTNLNELAHETIRELYNASKKVAVYSAGHPLTQKAVGRPFFLMGKAFKFKRFFNLQILSGQLHAMNIRIRLSVFSEQIMEYMQILDLRDILFEEGISANELTIFLERFVKRLPSTDYQNLMAVHLEKNKVKSVRVNSELGSVLSEKGRKFFGDVAGDFSVRNIVGQVMGNKIVRLAEMLESDKLDKEQYISRHAHDYRPELVRALMPEKIACMEVEYLAKEILPIIVREADEFGFRKENANVPEHIRELLIMLNYHPEREEVVKRLDAELVSRGISRDAYGELFSPVSAIKLETAERIDYYLNDAFDPAQTQLSLEEFEEHFGKLLRTAQQGKAKAVISYLLENLAGTDLFCRQRALQLLELSMSSYRKTTGTFLKEHLIDEIDGYLAAGEETFEFSELIWKLSQICHGEKAYDRLSDLCTVLAKKCRRVGGVMIFDSLAVKKAIAELDRREIINQLVWELMEGHSAGFPTIKNILVTIGSEEVALALSHIISHESRPLRQNVLKILSELGKSSLTVFSKILADDTYFEREEMKRELPDAKWYIVRNSIFVLGALKDPEACSALRIRIADEDVRVRRDIVAALEKIGGEQAIDLLFVLAEDPEREIREGAIIALGMSGRSEITPMLINLARTKHTEVIQVIYSLGNLGGQHAKQFLSDILVDPELQSELTSNRSSREELKLAAIKALGKIGDDDAIGTIRKFSESLSSSQKIFFGAGKLSKAADEFLDRPNRQS